VNFEVDALKANLSALLADLMKAKPAASKGHFLQKVSISTTMGVGIVVEHGSLGLAK
jgi:large subunit ribosomal protein L1